MAAAAHMTAEVTEFAQYPDVCSLYDPDVDGVGALAGLGVGALVGLGVGAGVGVGVGANVGLFVAVGAAVG